MTSDFGGDGPTSSASGSSFGSSSTFGKASSDFPTLGKSDFNKADQKERAPSLVPIWFDFILFALLCALIVVAVIYALVKASVFMGFAILWGGALALVGARFGLKRAREAWG